MSKPERKLSGLIQSGKVNPDPTAPAAPSFAADPAAFKKTATVQTGGDLRFIDLHLIDDSPYQPRQIYDPVRIDELGHSLVTGGLREPITVRQVGSRYELTAGGHRRVRAARKIGWQQIQAMVVVRSDREAELDAMLENESRVDLNDYERAKVYQRAIDKGFAKTQAEIAALFGCSQSKVSKCLAMLDLPEKVVAMLDAEPDLFSAATAKIIDDLYKAHPQQERTILESIDRLRHGAEQGSVKAWVEQMLRQKKTTKPRDKHIITNTAGRQIFTTHVKERDIVIRCSDPSIDAEQVQKWVTAALRERAEIAEKQEK